MKIAWVIWGLWPETSSKFYVELDTISRSMDDYSQAPFIIYNLPITKELNNKFLLRWEGIEEYLPFMVNAWKALEKAGVDFMLIPCNSVHILIDELREALDTPVISIIEETVEYLKEKKVNNIWVLSSLATAETRMYANLLEKEWFDIFLPTREEQDNINSLILKLVVWNYTEEDSKILYDVIEI